MVRNYGIEQAQIRSIIGTNAYYFYNLRLYNNKYSQHKLKIVIIMIKILIFGFLAFSGITTLNYENIDTEKKKNALNPALFMIHLI